MAERPLFGESFQACSISASPSGYESNLDLEEIGANRDRCVIRRQPTFVHGIPIFRGVQDHIGVDAPNSSPSTLHTAAIGKVGRNRVFQCSTLTEVSNFLHRTFAVGAAATALWWNCSPATISLAEAEPSFTTMGASVATSGGLQNRFHFPAVANFYHHATIKKKITCFYRGGQGAPGIAPGQDQCGGFGFFTTDEDHAGSRPGTDRSEPPTHHLQVAIATGRPFVEAEHGLGSDLPTNDGELSLAHPGAP